MKEINELIRKYPNDTDLGKAVRSQALKQKPTERIVGVNYFAEDILKEEEQENKEEEMILVDDPHYPNLGQRISKKKYEAQFKKEQESKEAEIIKVLRGKGPHGAEEKLDMNFMQTREQYCADCLNIDNDDICKKCGDSFCMFKAIRPSESKEQKIKDKCHKIYGKIRESWTSDKRTFEQAEQESKDEDNCDYKEQQPNIHNLKIGDKALRLKHDKWHEFTVNETYLPLIAEFPEDYKPIQSSESKEDIDLAEMAFNDHFEKQGKEQSAEEIPNEIVTQMQKEFQSETISDFRQGMYSGYAFGLQAGFKYAQQSRRDELIKFKEFEMKNNHRQIPLSEIDEYLNPKP